MKAEDFTATEVARARLSALEWLRDNDIGKPRSWAEEAKMEEWRLSRGHDQRYIAGDFLEAPPIAGYEALEREGVVIRGETATKDGEERIKFAKVPAAYVAALAAEDME